MIFSLIDNLRELLKPSIQIRPGTFTSGLYDLTLLPEPWEFPNNVYQSPERTPLTKQHVSDDGCIPERNLQEVSPVEPSGHVVQAQEESVFHSMIIDDGGKL